MKTRRHNSRNEISGATSLKSSTTTPSSTARDGETYAEVKERDVRTTSGSVAVRKSDLPPYDGVRFTIGRNKLYLVWLALIGVWASVFTGHPSFVTLALPYFYLLYVSAQDEKSMTHDVKVERHFSSLRAQEFELVRVEITVTNMSEYSMDFIEAFDRLPDEAAILAGSNHLLGSLNPGGSLTWVYEIEFLRRGLYQVGDLDLRIMNFLGTAATELTVEGSHELIKIIPRYEEMRVLKLLSRTRFKPGIFSDINQAGVGDNFYGIREYVRGDDVRKINWKTTARRGDMMINEEMWKRNLDFVVVLDATEDTLSTLDNTVRGVLSLSEYLWSLRNRVAFYRLSDPMSEMRMSSQPHRLHELTDMLVDVTGRKVKNIGVRMTRVMEMVTPFTIIVVFSPLLEKKLTEWQIRTRSAGVRIVCISPNPITIEDDIARSSKTMATANVVMQLDRKASIQQLTKAGIVVVDWDQRVPLEKSLEALKRPLNVM